jgi:hypothetical protein
MISPCQEVGKWAAAQVLAGLIKLQPLTQIWKCSSKGYLTKALIQLAIVLPERCSLQGAQSHRTGFVGGWRVRIKDAIIPGNGGSMAGSVMLCYGLLGLLHRASM